MLPTVSDLLNALEADYELHRRVSLRELRMFRRHLDEAFGGRPAKELTAQDVADYKRTRSDAGAAAATVNHELAWLRRAYRIAVEDGLLEAAPKVRLYPAHMLGLRTDYLELEEFALVLEELHAAPAVRDLIDYLYHTGWRLGEARALEWRHVRSQAIVFTGTKEAKLSRNGRGRIRVLPLAGRIGEILERRRAARDARSPAVFHRDGAPVGCFTKRWRSALARAGLEPVTLHALRRSFVRNAISAGLSETLIMGFTGHRTSHMVRRYNVLSEDQVAAAAEQLEAFRRARLEDQQP